MSQTQIIWEKNPERDSVCDTCKSSIEYSPYRKIVLQDQRGRSIELNFHYFFPCWDFSLINTRYPNYEIVEAGFTINDAANLDPNIIRNMSSNLDLWINDGY